MKTNTLHAALFTPMSDGNWGLPLLLIGAPGIAKSAIARVISRLWRTHLEVLSPGERGEGEFGVIKVMAETEHGPVMVSPPSDWCLKFRDDDGNEEAILLVDELNTAPPALQPALMGLVLDKRLGGHRFGGRVRVIGAMNPPGHGAKAWDLAAPVANRLGHLDWDGPTADEWADWLVGGAENHPTPKGRMADEEARVMAEWPAAFARACGLVASFVTRRPELLHKMPPDGDPAQSRAWPSPRSWEFATRALASAQVHGLTEIEADELVASFIGTDAAAELVTWVLNQDLPSPAELLDGAIDWEHDPKRLDRTAAVLRSCVALVVDENATKQSARVVALWKLLDSIEAKDLIVPAVRTLQKKRLTNMKEARPVLAKMLDVLDAAKGRTL